MRSYSFASVLLNYNDFMFTSVMEGCGLAIAQLEAILLDE